PTLPRRGTLSDDEVSRFNDEYVRAYGARGYDADRAYRLRRGDEELRFGATPRADLSEARDEPRRLLEESTSLGATGAAAMGVAGIGGAHAVSDEGKAINRELSDLPRERVVAREDTAADQRRVD